MRKPHAGRAALLALCCSLSACTGSIFESKVAIPDTYVISPRAVDASSTAAALNVDVAIGRPTVAPGLDTERIAVLREGQHMDYYAGARWGAEVSRVVQSFLVTALQRSGRFHSVTSEQARVAADYLLDIDLQQFQAVYDNATTPAVKVTAVASIVRIKDRALVGSIPVDVRVPAQENRLGAVISAFEAATQQAATQVGEQAAALITQQP